MAVDVLRQGHVHAHEHRGPDDGVEADDLLADEVDVGGEIALVIGGVVGVVVQTQRARVVEQRVDPDVYNVAGVEVHGDAPVEARTADAQILQTGLDEVVDHLVDAGARLEEVGVLEQVLHAVGVLAQTEEVGLLLGVVNLAAAVGALAVNQLALRPEALAGGAVLALIGALVDIALFVHLAENGLNRLDVIRIRRAHEAVVRDVHQLPQIQHAARAGDDTVDELLRRDAGLLGLRLDLLAVLVGAGQEHDVVALQALVAGQRVCRDGAVGVADVQLIRGIVDRRRDIILLFCFHGTNLLFRRPEWKDGLK